MNDHASPPPRVPPAGVWAPAITFFDPATDELDLAAQWQYYRYLSQHLTGLVILGTNAETFLLTREERAALLRTARDAVGPTYPLIAGCGGHSTKQVRGFLADAAAARADYALVLPCAYFGKQTTPRVVARFFDALAADAPLPLLVYNFPAVCNGVDLESDALAALAHRHPNVIVGTKLTCASVAKITRLAAAFPPDAFAVFGGQADFLLGGLAVGAAGCIAAFANVCPKVVARVYALARAGEHAEALRLHRLAATAELATKGGIAYVKFAAALGSAVAAGVERAEERVAPRAPYEALSEEVKEEVRARLAEVLAIEASL